MSTSTLFFLGGGLMAFAALFTLVFATGMPRGQRLVLGVVQAMTALIMLVAGFTANPPAATPDSEIVQ